MFYMILIVNRRYGPIQRFFFIFVVERNCVLCDEGTELLFVI